MEFVIRGEKPQEFYDFYAEPRKDGSVKFSVFTKNGTGNYSFVLSSEEFELFCKVRELCIIKEKDNDGV